MKCRTYSLLDDELHELFAATPKPWPNALGRLWAHHSEICAVTGGQEWLPKDASEEAIRAARRRKGPSVRRLAEVTGWSQRHALRVLDEERPFLGEHHQPMVH